jgi:hypothetical protein
LAPSSLRKLVDDKIGPVAQFVTARQQNPAKLSFGVKRPNTWIVAEGRKFPAFRGAPKAIRDVAGWNSTHRSIVGMAYILSA